MSRSPGPVGEVHGSTTKRWLGLVVALAVVVLIMAFVPATRWFFLISVVLGIVIAGGLHLFHKYKPLKEDDVEDKRPLKLG